MFNHSFTDYIEKHTEADKDGVRIAELLIDHSWGWEPCTMKEIKAYRPSVNSLNSGQILQKPYTFDEAKVVLQEMAESLALNLSAKASASNQIVLTVGYDRESLAGDNEKLYTGAVVMDHYGRTIPKHAHGSISLGRYSFSIRQIKNAALELYEKIVNPALFIRHLNITANHVISEREAKKIAENEAAQMSLFTDDDVAAKEEEDAYKREQRLQSAILSVQQKYDKNAMLKAVDLTKSATARERNRSIGGHKA